MRYNLFISIYKGSNGINMGVGTRKMEYWKMLFMKRLKLPMKRIANVMPVGFTDQQFYDAYKKYYPYMMDEAQKMCKDYKRHNYLRKQKGYKNTAYFPEPDELLKQASKSIIGRTRKAHNSGEVATDEELARNIASLEKDSKEKIAKRKQKEETFLQHAQDVAPKYINRLISSYFKTRKENTLDVNSRYLLLLEIAQYKCKESIAFLHQINASDKNNDMRYLAFNLLQQMGEHPWLARNRKGKKRLSEVKPIDISANPTQLVEHIYKYQGNIHRRYDVFLSHSSYDTKQLLRLKQQLNGKGLVVYIDWVNDCVMMDRKNQNEDTWNVLMLRMDESEKMLFVMTDNSLRSEWTQKEIDYFMSLKRDVVVYQPGEITEEPFEALAGCRTCKEDSLIYKTITKN